MLWEGFLGRFAGPDSFASSPEAQRQAYFAELQAAAEEMGKNEALVRSRFSIAPALMVLYLEAVTMRDTSPTAREFGAAVASLIDEGRKLRADTKPERPA